MLLVVVRRLRFAVVLLRQKLPSRSTVARWLLAIGLLLVSVIAAWPAWAAPFVRSAMIERLARRCGLPVHIDDLELGYGDVRIAGLRIGEAETDVFVEVPELLVDIDGGAIWRGSVLVDAVTVKAGRVTGTLEGIREFASTIAGPRQHGQAGRHRVVPERLVVEDLELAIRDQQDAPVRQFVGVLSLSGRPRERAMDVAISSIRLDGHIPMVAGRVASHLELVKDEHGTVVPVFPLTVELERLSVAVTPHVALAGVNGRVSVTDAALSQFAVDLSGGFSNVLEPESLVNKTTPELWSVRGTIDRNLTAGELTLHMASFELARIPEILRELPLVDSERATIGGRVSLAFAERRIRVEGELGLAGMNIEHRVLAGDTVRDIGFDLDVRAEVDPAARRLTIERARMQRNGVVVELSGEFVHPAVKAQRRYQAAVRVPPVSCQAVLQAIPVELVPSLQGFALSGTFELDVRTDIDFRDLDALRLDGKVGLWNCRATAVPSRVSADRLAKGFVHRVTMRDGRERRVELFAGSSSFTPLQHIASSMVAAVLTTEDGGFFRHRGFIPSQFDEALKRNLSAGKVRIGASTITMQMVKNVLLSHERTLARKVQEMFLTWYVETTLSKQRIMEIYLNVVEFAPGIYGVTHAANHYFGKDPEHLTPLECAYLALMLPSPVRRHIHYCKGAPSPAFEVKVRRVLGLMASRGRISELEYQQWKDAPLVFELAERPSESECVAEVQRLLQADEGQRALSGLLESDINPLAAEEAAMLEAEHTDRLPSLADAAESDAPGQPAMDVK